MVRTWALLAGFVFVACGDDAARPMDGGGIDAGGEAGTDAGRDAGLDSGRGTDAGPVDPRGVVLFSHTTGYRHAEAIAASVPMLDGLAAARGWRVTHTEDPAFFAPGALDEIGVVVFLYTSGDIFDASQQAVLEAHLARGGGFVGIHSATDTEYDWPWYGELIGAWFASHPPGLPRGTILVGDAAHPASAHLPASWTRDEEWYAFRTNPADVADLHVLLTLDETSLDLPPEHRMGVHPLAWYRHVHGGRSFVTALGHAGAAWSEPAFVEHVAGGIDWALGRSFGAIVLDELNGTTEPGTWDPHATAAAFPYEVTRDALTMTVAGGANQHLTRRGVLLDAAAPYSIDALFTIAAPTTPGDDLNSFALNFQVQGEGGSADDLTHISAWAINLDLSSSDPGAGVIKHMGFLDGSFRQIGETRTRCCGFGRELRLRVDVNTALDGTPAPDIVVVTLSEGRTIHERFAVDYATFPYQPDPAQPVRIGANTHGADWTMRDLRVRRR